MRLFVLDFGVFEFLHLGEERGYLGYVVQTQTGENILIDTGWPARYGREPSTLAEDGLDSKVRPVHFDEQNLLTTQLATLDLTPSDIDLLILSHSDPDHIGGIGVVPSSVPVVIGRAERALTTPRYNHDPATASWPSHDYQTVDADFQLRPGLRVITTPGHTPGHLSVLVELQQIGSTLLAIDAIARESELGSDSPVLPWNGDLAASSVRKLARIAENERAWIVYGHDLAQWRLLRKAPLYYD